MTGSLAAVPPSSEIDRQRIVLGDMVAAVAARFPCLATQSRVNDILARDTARRYQLIEDSAYSPLKGAGSGIHLDDSDVAGDLALDALAEHADGSLHREGPRAALEYAAYHMGRAEMHTRDAGFTLSVGRAGYHLRTAETHLRDARGALMAAERAERRRRAAGDGQRSQSWTHGDAAKVSDEWDRTHRGAPARSAKVARARERRAER